MATTTPNYGWPVPTSTDYVKDGATAIEALGDAVDATVFGLGNGLKLIKTQTIGTAVSSVTVTSAFSATYNNYKIVISGSNAAAAGNEMRITFSGSAGSSYFWSGYQTIYNGARTDQGNNNVAYSVIGQTDSTSITSMMTDIYSPFASTRTAFTSQYANSSNSGNYGGVDNNAASHTAFTIATPTTLTGGTIKVYGYQNS
jgi:hypothetical protein